MVESVLVVKLVVKMGQHSVNNTRTQDLRRAIIILQTIVPLSNCHLCVRQIKYSSTLNQTSI